MTRLRRGVPIVLVALALGLGGGAALAKDKPRGRIVEGETVERSVTSLFKTVPFKTSLDEAKAEAAAKGKLIVWIHALGNLSGDT